MESTRGIPLIKTKMMIPSGRENLVHRYHLMDRIEKGIREGFILVSCPPGYGKTMLVADWAKQCAAPVAWLTLDEKDNDLLTFNRYLKMLLDNAFSGTTIHLIDFPLEGNSQDNYHTLLAALINGCTELESDLTLILDDYHVITNLHIHEGITFLLDHFPNHLRLVIVTRSDPPFSLARLRANHRIEELHAADLAFSLKETGQFINETNRLNLTESEIAQLYKETEGWITGLQLTLLVQKDASIRKLAGFSISSNTNLTLEYLVDEVLNHQPPEIQDFLLRTSILEYLYGPLCSRVINAPDSSSDSQDLLHRLYHTNLFLSPLDGEYWYRYHALFSEVLRRLLVEKYPAEIPTLYERASEWCDENGFYQEAMTYAMGTGDKARITGLLEKYSIEAIKQNRILDIIGWIRRTDSDLLSTSPILSLICSWGFLLGFDIDSSEIWLEKARRLVETGDYDVNDRYKLSENKLWGLIVAAQSILAAARGDNENAMRLSGRALELLPADNDFSHSFAMLNQAITLAINGEVDKGIQVLKETIRLSKKSGNFLVMFIARSNLGELLVGHGQLNQALELFEQSLQFFSAMPGKFTGFESYLYKELADIYLARNQLAEAHRYIQMTVEISNQWLPSINDIDTHIRLARLYNCMGELRRSKEEIATAREISTMSQSKLDDLIVDLLDIKLALQRGQIIPAQKWMQKNEISDDDCFDNLKGNPFPIKVYAQMVIARLYLVQGRLANDRQKYDRVIKKVDNIIPTLVEVGLIEHLIEAFVLLALAYHELGDNEKMIDSLVNALKLAEPEEYRQVFLDEGIPMSRLLIQYLAVRKQKKNEDDFSGIGFASDLLFRMTGKELSRDKSEAQADDEWLQETPVIELLTARESEVLQLVARGRTNNEIAADLHISVNTVKRHLNNTFMKLGVSTRTQAIRVARQQSLIP